MIKRALLGVGLTVLCFAPSNVDAGPVVGRDCMFKGHKLWGKFKVVTSFPDLKVKVVENFPDLKVKTVESFPDSCGKWKMVDSFPDVKIQFVENVPDIKIKYVDSFQGLP